MCRAWMDQAISRIVDIIDSPMEQLLSAVPRPTGGAAPCHWRHLLVCSKYKVRSYVGGPRWPESRRIGDCFHHAKSAVPSLLRYGLSMCVHSSIRWGNRTRYRRQLPGHPHWLGPLTRRSLSRSFGMLTCVRSGSEV
jgi:hypothetical protein